MTGSRHNYIEFETTIRIMQGNKKILYEAVGRVLKKRRKDMGQKLTIFCYENDIPTTSLSSIEAARTEACYFNIFKIAKALNLSCEEFGRLLDKELPEDFMAGDEL